MKMTADGEQYGPYSGAELKQYAGEGRVPRNALVSTNQTSWHPAEKVKGLFASASATANALTQRTAAAGTAAAKTPAASTARPATSPGQGPAAAAASARPTAGATPKKAPAAQVRPALSRAPAESGPIEEDPLAALSELAEESAVLPLVEESSDAAAPGLAYYAPRTDLAAAPFKPRKTIVFFIIAGLMLANFALLIANTWVMESVAVAIGCGIATLLLIVLSAIFWLLWVHRAHSDMKKLTGELYDVSPGKAVGFSFIPLFDAFWIVYMPYRLANELNRHLASRGLKQVSAPAVMSCQILSILAAFPLSGIVPALYAVSMWQVQSGLNRLSTQGA